MVPESYGAVSIATTSKLRRRHLHPSDCNIAKDELTNDQSIENRYSAKGAFSIHQHQNSRNQAHKSSLHIVVYKYNSTIAKLLIPSLSITYLCHHSPIPLLVTMYVILCLYGVDLCGSREGVIIGIWIACGSIFISFVAEYYSYREASWGFLGLITDAMNLFCLGCWSTLQMKWLYRDALPYAKFLEAKLHSLLPLAVAAVSCRCLDIERYANYCSCTPFLYAVILTCGIYLMANVPSSFSMSKKPNLKSHPLPSGKLSKGKEIKGVTGKNELKSVTNNHSISETGGYVLSYSLLVFPTLIAILTHHSDTIMDEIIYLILVQSSSYILHSMLKSKKVLWWYDSFPYLTVGNRKVSKLAAAVMSAVLSFQYTYLHSTTQYQHVFPIWLIYFCFNFGFAGLAFIFWIYTRRHERGELFLGNKHERSLRLLLLASLLSIGISIPAPDDVILPSAASIFCIATIVLTNMYQILELSISCNILLLIAALYRNSTFFGNDIGFLHIILMSTFVASLIFSVHNLSLDGTTIMSSDRTKFRLVGPLLFFYICIITIIEWALNVESVDQFHLPSDTAMFPEIWTYFTSVVFIIMSLHLSSLNITASFSTQCLVSIALGKAFASTIAYERQLIVHNDQLSFVYYCLACSITTWIYLVPYYGTKDTFPLELLQCHGTIAVNTKMYLGLMLPAAIICSVYLIISSASPQFTQNSSQLKWPTAFYYLFGYSCVLWGAMVLCFQKRLDPNGGFGSWRKPAICVFLLGAIELALSPTSSFLLTIWKTSDPFKSVSSVIHYDEHQTWNARWGLISMCMGLFLYYLGPLRPRGGAYHDSKSKKMRCIAFSLFFGCGLNYFLINKFGLLLSPVRFGLVIFSTSTVAFTLTFSAMMMLHTSVKTLATSAKVLEKRMIASFALLMFIFILNLIFEQPTRPSGDRVDCAEMFVLSIFSILISSLLKLKKFRYADIHDIHNSFATISWVTSTICVYGCFGIASINVNSRLACVFGLQGSIVLTFLASLLLMDITKFEGRRASMIRSGASKGLNKVHFVTVTERLLLCAFGSLTIYIVAAFYSIALRGMWGSVPMSHADFINSVSHSKGEEKDTISNLVAKYIPHKELAARASRLAACGFWTSKKRLVPLKHVIGLVMGPLFTWKKTYGSLLVSHQSQGHSIDASTIFFNALVLLTCRGIPPQTAASWMCIFIVFYQSYAERNRRWKSKMII